MGVDEPPAYKPRKPNPLLLDPVFYFRVTAWVLGLVTLLGIISTSLNYSGKPQDQFLSFGGNALQFTWTHNILHVVLAGAAVLFGYGGFHPTLVKRMAIVFGSVYLVLGVLGFFVLEMGDFAIGRYPEDMGVLALTWTLNVVHILLGAWALAAGLLSND